MMLFKEIKSKIFILAISFMITSCASTGYLVENFDEFQNKHETVAILPVDVKINIANQAKGVTDADLRKKEKSDSLVYQKLLQSRFLEKYGKGSFTVKFQDVGDTNTLLKRNNSLDETGSINKTKAELRDILDVDAVLSTTINLSKPMSQGGAIVTGLLFGVGSANKADISVNIHDLETGILIWDYETTLEGLAFSNEDQLVRSLVAGVSNTFPYKKKNK
jgi:hypothetical protein